MSTATPGPSAPLALGPRPGRPGASAPADTVTVPAAATAAAERRRRAAHVLRNGAQERLACLLLRLRTAREQTPDASPGAALLDDAVHDAEEALTQVRQVAAELCPQVLELRGLRPALATLAVATPMSVSLRCDPDLRLPRALEVQVYILVAEAVAHAADVCGATRADVELTVMGTGLVVRVVSDACPPQEQGDERRLVAMTECVTLLAGTLTVTCSPVGMGTTVRAVLPVPPRTE